MSDLISRHGVSAWLDNLGYSKLSDYVMDEDRFPSAEPERKKGKWNQIISIPNDMYGRYYCSECGKEGNPLWYFCPCCGADMR